MGLLQQSSGSTEFSAQPLHYNPLDEPSPLGLRLRKSPSLLDLIQIKLSQGNASSVASVPEKNLSSRTKKDARGTSSSAATDKMKVKASNFPASLLRIGCWEVAVAWSFLFHVLNEKTLSFCLMFYMLPLSQFVSRYEGDLVAKCYFHKSKLVWEVLESGLKSKIEIQWSDIMALKANCPDDGPGTLTVVVFVLLSMLLNFPFCFFCLIIP